MNEEGGRRIPILDGVVVTPVGHIGEIEHLIERAGYEVTIMTEDEIVSLLGGPVGVTAPCDEPESPSCVKNRKRNLLLCL